MIDQFLEIINHYGAKNQQRKLAEEVFELQEAITLFESGQGDVKNVIEEIADVYVLLEQFEYYYEIEPEEIGKVIQYKVNRTIERMK